jgi:hypothetical protein
LAIGKSRHLQILRARGKLNEAEIAVLSIMARMAKHNNRAWLADYQIKPSG